MIPTMHSAAGVGVVGLLLASGFGRRFDAGGRRNKLLARLPDGRTVVSASARALCDALEHVAVVVPSRGTLLEAALSDLPVRLIRNAQAKDGIGASIAVGIAALRSQHPHATGWLIALGDMPFILPRTIRAIAGSLPGASASTRLAIAAAHRGQRGHPVAFTRAFDDDLVALRGDVGANGLLVRDETRTLDCADPGVVRDIDTREDLASLTAAAR